MLAGGERGGVDDRRWRRVLILVVIPILILVVILMLVLVLVLGTVLKGGPSRRAHTGVTAKSLVGQACFRRNTWIKDKMLFSSG